MARLQKLRFILLHNNYVSYCLLHNVQERECDLIIPALGIRGVGWLIPNKHVIEIQPCEGEDWTSMIGQMSDEAVQRGFSDVENQVLFGCFFVFTV